MADGGKNGCAGVAAAWDGVGVAEGESVHFLLARVGRRVNIGGRGAEEYNFCSSKPDTSSARCKLEE